jgi:hypothetical protein
MSLFFNRLDLALDWGFLLQDQSRRVLLLAKHNEWLVQEGRFLDRLRLRHFDLSNSFRDKSVLRVAFTLSLRAQTRG